MEQHVNNTELQSLVRGRGAAPKLAPKLASSPIMSIVFFLDSSADCRYLISSLMLQMFKNILGVRFVFKK